MYKHGRKSTLNKFCRNISILDAVYLRWTTAHSRKALASYNVSVNVLRPTVDVYNTDKYELLFLMNSHKNVFTKFFNRFLLHCCDLCCYTLNFVERSLFFVRCIQESHGTADYSNSSYSNLKSRYSSLMHGKLINSCPAKTNI